jgi:hypothetical protein
MNQEAWKWGQVKWPKPFVPVTISSESKPACSSHHHGMNSRHNVNYGYRFKERFKKNVSNFSCSNLITR